MMFGILRATAAAIVLAMAVVAAPAQNVADFYKGRNVELYIGYSVGGGYDLWARVLARHIGRGDFHGLPSAHIAKLLFRQRKPHQQRRLRRHPAQELGQMRLRLVNVDFRHGFQG